MQSLHPAAADHSVSIRGSQCTALIILSLRSRAVVHHYCSPTLRVKRLASEYGRYSAAAVVAVSWEKRAVPVKTVTLGVCGGQLPCVLSTEERISLKE